MTSETLNKVDRIIDKIKGQLYNEDSKQGFLRNLVNKYTNCFKIDVPMFTQLIAKDSKHWKAELKKAKETQKKK